MAKIDDLIRTAVQIGGTLIEEGSRVTIEFPGQQHYQEDTSAQERENAYNTTGEW